MGYYGQPDPTMGYYGQPDPTMGYYGQPDPTMGYYGQPDPTMGYYGQADPSSGYYGEMPEMPGYAGYAQAPDPGVSYYGDPYLAGYVRQARPAYNPGCPMPTNVAGYAEAEPLEGYDGYVKPSTVNAGCEQVTPQPGPAPGAPDSFRALW